MLPARAYRRCHLCLTFCEHDGEVKRCDGCGKPFAPFYYYDDHQAPVLSAQGLRPAPRVEGEWRPIQGLTAYWSAD